ncbi:helix-turn-helix domain-containing protein [Labilibaculum manganireducens]|uniref:helix-turn-helix domain-containing protein n=1 Tax=Labilibaculum manganireducens TaxID=1940525 RepID=UPI0029F540FB|nr:helix-turn-helix domain-containing protein [Labilibaculum manganireducens]
MSFIDDKEKLERLDQLIRLKATGNLEELAEKFGASKSTISRTIKDLKEIGCPIIFNKDYRSYSYEYPGKLLIKFDPIDKSELHKIKGGFLEKIFALSYNDIEADYVCTEKPIISFSGFPTPNNKVGVNFYDNEKQKL